MGMKELYDGKMIKTAHNPSLYNMFATINDAETKNSGERLSLFNVEYLCNNYFIQNAFETLKSSIFFEICSTVLSRSSAILVLISIGRVSYCSISLPSKTFFTGT